jgi:signal transduction histidine kinase
MSTPINPYDLLKSIVQLSTSSAPVKIKQDWMLQSISDAFQLDRCFLLRPEEIIPNGLLSRLASERKTLWVEEGFSFLKENILPEEKDFLCPAFACISLYDEFSFQGILYIGFSEDHKFHPQEVDLLLLIGETMGAVIRNDDLRQKAEETISELTALNEMGKAVTSTLQLKNLFELIISTGFKILKAKGGVLRVFDRRNGALEVKCSHGDFHNNPLDEKIAKRVFYTRTPLAFNHSGEEKPSLSILCAPFLSKGRSFGTLAFYDKDSDSSKFDERDLQLLLMMANQMSCAIENALLYRNLEEVHQELKETQTSLVHLEKMVALGEMSTTIAHEIKNPLTSIGGFARRLDRTIPQESQEKKYSQTIIKEVSRLEKILDDLLNYTRDESLIFKEVDLRSILEENLSMITQGVHLEGIQLIKEYAGEVHKVIGDPHQLKQAFFNLINNACQAMKGEGTLSLRVHPFSKNGSAYVRVEIEDTGKGIDLENLHNIFNPFYSTKESSLGLGLPIVHKIITSHRGQIEVDNHPGKGVNFIITLPVQAGTEKN